MQRTVIFALSAAVALFLGVAAAAAPFTAGERHFTTTSANAAVRAHGDPKLRLLVWYPATAAEHEIDMGPPGAPVFIAGSAADDAPFADDARYPLIVVSHGFGGTARQMTWLGTVLARHGYVVVAVDHPGTNGEDGVTDEGAFAPWERANDIRAALDFALASPDLAPHIDGRRIGFAGFSLGGFTGLLEVGARADFDQFRAFCASPERDAICNQQLEHPMDLTQMNAILARPEMRAMAAEEHDNFRDPRIRAAFLIAPAAIKALTVDSLRSIDAPVAIFLGSGDPIAPPATNGELAAKLIPGAQITVLPGVGHYDFLSECGPGSAKTLAAYCMDGIGTHRGETHAVATLAAITFFEKAFAR